MSNRLPAEEFQKFISLGLATVAVCAVSAWWMGSFLPALIAVPVMWGTYYVILGLWQANR